MNALARITSFGFDDSIPHLAPKICLNREEEGDVVLSVLLFHEALCILPCLMNPHEVERTLFKIGGMIFGITISSSMIFNFGAAQEVNISGEIEVGFGRVKLEKEGTSHLDGIGEATINFAAKEGPVSAQVEIVVAESAEELDSVEHEVVWSPAQNLSITISGSSFGIAATEGNISVVNAPGGPVGDEEAFVDFAETGMLNIELTASQTIVGLAFLDDCIPDCGFGLDSASTEPIHPDLELMTVVVHVRGSAASLSYNAYLAASSGAFSSSDQDGMGRGGGFGLLYEDQGFWVGLDLSLVTVKCSANAGDMACTDDNKQTRYGVGLSVGGLGVHYFFGESETGPQKEKTTNIDVVYLFEIADATVGPEIRSTTVETVGGMETTDFFALFGMSLQF